MAERAHSGSSDKWSCPVDAFDHGIARWFAEKRTPRLSDLAEVGTSFGATTVSLVVSTIIGVGPWVWRRSVDPALFVALVVSGIQGNYFEATSLDPRQRPPVKILDAGLVPDHSLPSGHVGTAIALLGLIVVLVDLCGGTLVGAAARGAARADVPGCAPPHRRADEPRRHDGLAGDSGSAGVRWRPQIGQLTPVGIGAGSTRVGVRPWVGRGTPAAHPRRKVGPPTGCCG